MKGIYYSTTVALWRRGKSRNTGLKHQCHSVHIDILLVAWREVWREWCWAVTQNDERVKGCCVLFVVVVFTLAYNSMFLTTFYYIFMASVLCMCLWVEILWSTPRYCLTCNWLSVLENQLVCFQTSHTVLCISIKTMHQATATPPPTLSSASTPQLSYLYGHSHLLCAGTPQHLAGSRPGRAGSARG